jgi:hypothetical protein
VRYFDKFLNHRFPGKYDPLILLSPHFPVLSSTEIIHKPGWILHFFLDGNNMLYEIKDGSRNADKREAKENEQKPRTNKFMPHNFSHHFSSICIHLLPIMIFPWQSEMQAWDKSWNIIDNGKRPWFPVCNGQE